MKFKYVAEDSGRTLINNLSLVPGVEYTATDKDVRYAEGVTVIGVELAQKLCAKGILKKIEEVVPAEEPKKAESKEPKAVKEG